MVKLNANQAIGLFDSGIGGLTVAHELHKACPNEDLIYFGDTAHLPYGDKSPQAIISYAAKISEFLLSQNVKMIIIACNSASSVATQYLQETIGDQVRVINVIEPLVNALQSQTQHHKLGLIGTRRTIESQRYQQQFQQYGTTLQAHATPLFAAAIEEGFAGTPLMQHLIQHYLSTPHLAGIDNLILGCTHYPIIKDQIKQYYHQQSLAVTVTDPSAIIAATVKSQLDQDKLAKDVGSGGLKCYLSDVTDSFIQAAPLFFTESVEVVKYPLWD